MAAVTVTKRRDNVNGNFREFYYTLTIATTGDTLQVKGMGIIANVTSSTVAITDMAISGNTITFTTTGGPVTGAFVRVTGQ